MTHTLTYTTSRQYRVAPADVFAAFADPQRLARWWGPAGFSNRFAQFVFETGGAWRFTMVGPDGREYANESEFVQIEPDRQVVIRHVNHPQFQLTISLMPHEGGTLLRWEQVFDDAAVGAAMRSIVEPANEQNLDRLAVELSAH